MRRSLRLRDWWHDVIDSHTLHLGPVTISPDRAVLGTVTVIGTAAHDELIKAAFELGVEAGHYGVRRPKPPTPKRHLHAV